MITPAPDEQELAKLFPHIHTLSLIDSGGFKTVYRAETAHGCEALKVVHIPPLSTPDARAAMRVEAYGRVKRELEALRTCAVPELVRLGSVVAREVEIGGNDYVVYSEEFLEGANVRQLIRTPHEFPDECELRVLLVCILRVIKALWRNGYVHRDIKPENIIKHKSQERPFVVLDLGIAFCVRDTALTYDPASRLPPATYRYIAPEMLRPNFRETIDYRSDLYSAALTVYEYAAKCHALARDSDDLMATLGRALAQPAVPLEKHRPGLAGSVLCRYVNDLLRKQPALRPARIDSIINELEIGL